MARSELKALSDFIKASRNQPQSSIIKEFLATIIKGKHVCESGSILVDNPIRKKLVLFNDSDFLVKQGFLPENEPWSKEFGYFDGIAGLTFRTMKIHRVNGVNNHPSYSERDGDVPIANMVCAPILFGDAPKRPFGVVSFHNSDAERIFTEDDETLIEAYTDALGVMLEISQHHLDWEKSKRVFIVHGHDTSAKEQLVRILKSHKLTPVVMQEQLKTGQELLEMLENLIKGCQAGFVIATPDDVGKGKNDPEENFKPRARQNVIFESGILTSLFRANRNIYFLIKESVDLPSDMHGLLYNEFKNNIDKDRIEQVLIEWGMIEPRKKTKRRKKL